MVTCTRRSSALQCATKGDLALGYSADLATLGDVTTLCDLYIATGTPPLPAAIAGWELWGAMKLKELHSLMQEGACPLSIVGCPTYPSL